MVLLFWWFLLRLFVINTIRWSYVWYGNNIVSGTEGCQSDFRDDFPIQISPYIMIYLQHNILVVFYSQRLKPSFLFMIMENINFLYELLKLKFSGDNFPQWFLPKMRRVKNWIDPDQDKRTQWKKWYVWNQVCWDRKSQIFDMI